MPTISNTRANIRIQQIARYRVGGRLQDKQIAEIMGMSVAAFKYLIATPQYQSEENALLEGHISKLDMELAENVEAMRGYFKKAVPVAARTLLEIVQQRRDLRAALSAASEILDRDPNHSFAKQGRAPGTENAGQPGQGFNAMSAGAMITGMTVEATKVTAQITTAPIVDLRPNEGVVPVTILASESAQLPLFGSEAN